LPDLLPAIVKSPLGVLCLLLVPLPLFASVSVRGVDRKTIDVAIVREPFSTALRAIQPYLPGPVDLLLGETDPVVTYRAHRIAPMDALRAMVTIAHLELADDNSGLWVRDRKEPSVTLDVKEEDARSILTSIQRQCPTCRAAVPFSSMTFRADRPSMWCCAPSD
jgi:hypothetical protein